MKHLIVILALSMPMLGPTPAMANDPTPTETPEDGPSLMERGVKLFFRGLAQEMEPALREFGDFIEEAGPAMQSFLREMGPVLNSIFDEVQDFSRYHPPEILPNGDIIMRRKQPEDTPASPDIPKGEEIEL